MAPPTEVLLCFNDQEIPLTLSPNLTFPSLLQQAHDLWRIPTNPSTPYHLSLPSGLSLSKAGTVNVTAYLANLTNPRILFSPLTPALPAQTSEDDSDGEAADKENRPQGGTVKGGQGEGQSIGQLSLPPSSAPIHSQLWRIFTHYCLLGLKVSGNTTTCPFDSLSSTHWVKVLEDAAIISPPTPPTSPPTSSLPSFSRHQADLLHLTLSKKGGNKFHFDAFLLGLSKVATTAYKFSSDPSDLLHALLTRHILPLAARYNPLEHTPLLSQPTVQSLVSTFTPYHTATFAVYSTAAVLSYAAFMQWTVDCKLSKLIPPVELSRCFLSSVEEGEGAAWWAGPGKLRLDPRGFNVCMARILTQGVSRKHPLNAYTMKSVYQHCVNNPPPRVVKGASADRKGVDRMLKALDAAFQPMWKADGKRDYLTAGSQVRSHMEVEGKATAYHLINWTALMEEDGVWAVVERGLTMEAEKAAEVVEVKKQRRSLGSARTRPAAVKTAPVSKGSAKKGGVGGAKGSQTPKEGSEGMDFGSPKTPRVVALVPRTPAAKRREEREEDSEGEEEDDGEEEREEEERRAAEEREHQAEEARQLQLRMQVEKQAEEEEARQAKAQREREEAKEREDAVQSERMERELRWQREKDAEVATIRERERVERERMEESMQREIARLKQQLAMQQTTQLSQVSQTPQKTAEPTPPATPTSSPVEGVMAEDDEVDGEEEEELDSDEEDVNTTVIKRGDSSQTPSRAVFHPSPVTPATPLQAFNPALYSPGSALPVQSPFTPMPPSPPIREERPLPTTVLQAKRPSTAAAPLKQNQQPVVSVDVQEEEAVAVEVAVKEEVKEAAKEEVRDIGVHQRMAFTSSGQLQDSEDEEDSDVEEAEAQPTSGESREEEEEEDEDVGAFTVDINCSFSLDQSLALSMQPRDDEAASTSDEEDSDHLHTADTSQLTNVSHAHALISHSRQAPSEMDTSAMDDERTVQIHQAGMTGGMDRSFSQTHWNAAGSPTKAREEKAEEAIEEASEKGEGEKREEEEEDDVIAEVEFDEAAHAERLRLLQAELKERLEGRRRLMRRASYVEEVEENRMRAEMAAKQKALHQLRMMKARQERERIQAELALTRQRQQAEAAALAAKAEVDASTQQVNADADTARRAQEARRQSAAVNADVALLAKQKATQWESLVKSVERGDTFTRVYDRWYMKPKPKFIRVSMVGSPKLWWGADMFNMEKHIDLVEVKGVRRGSEMAVVGRVPVDGLACAFSVLTEGKDIHLIAASHATREVWCRFFERWIDSEQKETTTTTTTTLTAKPQKAGEQRKSGPPAAAAAPPPKAPVKDVRKSAGVSGK